MNATVIQAEGIGKRYRIGGVVGYMTLRDSIAAAARWLAGRSASGATDYGRHDMFWALRDVSFKVMRGEVVGIIGPNGAGKSTLLKVLSRITAPTTGWARIYGRVGSLLEVGTGFHPELTGRENVFLNAAILGMNRREVARKLDEIVAFAEVERFIDTPVKFYSSGMYTRLAFSVAAHLEPDILIVDEVLAVGDVTFQQKCLQNLGTVSRQGRTVILVSHNMSAILSLCRRAMLLNKGRVVEDGDPASVVNRYKRAAVGNLLAQGASPGVWVLRRQEGHRIKVTHIEIIDPVAGERKTEISTGDAVVFRIHYSTEAELKHVAFQLTISAPHDSVALIAARTDADRIPILLRANATGFVDCCFAVLPLAANRAETYFLGVHVYDPRNGEMFFDGTEFGEFTVLPRDVPGRRYPVNTGASWIAVDYTWDLRHLNDSRGAPSEALRYDDDTEVEVER